jgi:hypothetical protein
MSLILQARAIAATVVLGVAFYIVFAIAGEPWGTLNDISGALLAALIAQLEWSTRDDWRAPRWALGAGLVGAAVAILGSALVVFHVTGWFLAGLVTTFGFAGVGLWLLAVNRGESRLATVTGALMAAGLIVLPGVLLRYDDPARAPGWVYAGFISWIGLLLFPWWTWRAVRGSAVAPTLAAGAATGRS